MFNFFLLLLSTDVCLIHADQACHGESCPPKVNSLLQVGGRSTDIQLATVNQAAAPTESPRAQKRGEMNWKKARATAARQLEFAENKQAATTSLCSVQLDFYTESGGDAPVSLEVQPSSGKTLDGTGGFTLAAWVYRYSNVSEWDGVFQSVPDGSTWHAGVGVGFRQGFRHYMPGTGGDMDVDRVFPDNKWTHYAVVHANTRVATIYWNGIKMSEATINLPRLHPSGSKYTIGDFDGGGRSTPGGSLKDVFVFNQALTVEELMTLKDDRRLPDDKVPVITACVTTCGQADDQAALEAFEED